MCSEAKSSATLQDTLRDSHTVALIIPSRTIRGLCCPTPRNNSLPHWPTATGSSGSSGAAAWRPSISPAISNDRLVALKVLQPELAASLGSDRFLREIRTAARLQHPHILSVHDSGETAGQLWFTMPYVEGESLRDRLERDQKLPVDDALR